MRELIEKIEAMEWEDEKLHASFTVLSEYVKHHVKEEEQRDGMFAQAKADAVDLDALGQQLAERKQQLTDSFNRNGLPQPETRTMKRAPKLKLGHPVA